MPDPGLLPDASRPDLPDLGWLTQLANEMFHALPDAPLPGLAAGPVPPPKDLRPPQAAPQIGSVPGASGGAGFTPPSTHLPDVPVLNQSIPGYEPLNLLSSPAPAAPVPAAGTVPTGAAGITGLEPQPSVSSLDTSVPWEAELRALLASAPATTPFAPTHQPAAPAAAEPSFYFLQEAGHPGAIQPPGTAFPAVPTLDANARRGDFPILSERVNGRPLIWLDNGATTQKPRAVIDRLVYFYEHENSNIHRAAHELAARATDAYEGARETVRRFVHARSADEIVFVRGTTEAINLVAQSWGRKYIGAGDEIVISWLEHHANIVPWQMLCAQTGAKLKVAPVDDDGHILLDEYGKLLGPRTKLVSFTQVSNALGTITPSTIMTQMAHAVGARVLLDGAQSVSHMRTDVQSIGCDWFVFSGHKVFGPTGIGALYGRADVLEESPPWQGGGNMIKDVTFEHTEYHAPPTRFEAGTGNIGDAVGLGAALDYVEQVGLEAIAAHEHELLQHATHALTQIPGLRMLGTAAEKAGVISFVIQGFNNDDIGKALNREGIAVRTGHHCAQPILRRMGVETSVRASLALYNTHADIDALVSALHKIRFGAVGSF